MSSGLIENLGKYGEEIAFFYLRKKGYKILERNYKRKTGQQLLGEIDFIARKKDIIFFIEVKSSLYKKETRFYPEDRVNFKKKAKIIKTAEYWLENKKIELDSKWQIDVLSIRIDFKNRKARIKHFQNI